MNEGARDANEQRYRQGIEGRLDRIAELLKELLPKSAASRLVPEAEWRADKYHVSVWSMHDGFPEEWVVVGPDGVISHHDNKYDARVAAEKLRRKVGE